MPPHKGKPITNPPIEIVTEAAGTYDSSEDSDKVTPDQNRGILNSKCSSSAEGVYQQSLHKRHSSTKASTTRGGKRAKTASINEDKERKEERRAANRLSAFRSRQRTKFIIEELQTRVQQLLHERDELRKTYEERRLQVENAMNENQLLRQQSNARTVIPSSSQVIEQSVAPQVALPPVLPVPGVFLDVNNNQEVSFPISAEMHTSQSTGLSNQVVGATTPLISQCGTNSDPFNSEPVPPENPFRVQNQTIQQQVATLTNHNDNLSTNVTISLGSNNPQHQLAMILALLTGQAATTASLP